VADEKGHGHDRKESGTCSLEQANKDQPLRRKNKVEAGCKDKDRKPNAENGPFTNLSRKQGSQGLDNNLCNIVQGDEKPITISLARSLE
jgi:hypothetical protein